MNKQQLNGLAQRFIEWHLENRNTTRLQKHEAIKAMLFAELKEGARLEYKITDYHNDRSGLIDYVDCNSAIEIDDGPNVKSIRKLSFARKEMGLNVFWILVLSSGKGGKSLRIARKASIPILRIFARNNRASFEWID